MNLMSPDFGLIAWMIISLLFLILPLIALIDILTHRFSENNKIILILVVIFIPLLGSILYFVIGRKQRI